MTTSYLLKISSGALVMPLVLTGGAGWSFYSSSSEGQMPLAARALDRVGSVSVPVEHVALGGMAASVQPRMILPVYGPAAPGLQSPGKDYAVQHEAKLRAQHQPLSQPAERIMRDGVPVIRLALPEAADPPASGIVTKDPGAQSGFSGVSDQAGATAAAMGAGLAAAATPVLAESREASLGATSLIPDGQKVGAGTDTAALAAGQAGLSMTGLGQARPAPAIAEVASAELGAARAAPGVMEPVATGSGETVRPASPAIITVASDFDLARTGAQTRVPVEVTANTARPLARPAVQRATVASPANARARTAGLVQSDAPRQKVVGARVYSVSRDVINFTIPVDVNGKAAGSLALQISDGNTISVRLADFLELFRNDPAAGSLQGLAGTQAAQEYVTLDRIRAAGIPVSYDAAHDRLVF